MSEQSNSPEKPTGTTPESSTGNNAKYNKNNNNNNYNQRQGNRQPYNKRNSYHSKMNSNQYNYTSAQAAAYNMNMMNYYYNYGGYGVPVPMYTPNGQPVISSPPNSYGSPVTSKASPNPVQGGVSPVPAYSSFPTGKVKLTDKSGKEINLEDKKKQYQKSSSSTPITSPIKSFASPVKAQINPYANAPVAGSPAPVVAPVVAPVATPTAIPVPVATPQFAPPASATPETPSPDANKAPVADPAVKMTAIEEFRERIRQKALALQKAKEEKEAGEKPVTTETKPTESKEAEAKPTESKPAESKPTETKPTEVKEENKEEIKPVDNKEPEVPVQPKQPVESKEVEPKEAEPKEAEPKEVEPKESESKEVEPKESESKEPTDVADASEPKEESKSEEEADDGADDDDEGDEEQEEGQEMDLSQFFEKIQQATPIDDPFTTKYPEPLVSVDPRWKSETKKYRYDPQFLIQFQNVVQFEIDEEWKNKLSSLGIVAQTNQRRFGSQRGGNNRGGLPNRFNQVSGRGGNFDRQNSRNGSKRKGGSTRDKSKRNNQSRRRDKDEEPKLTIAPEDIKPLEKSENRWVPRSRAKKTDTKIAPDGVTVILDEEEVERKVKSLLNKLTLEMFEPITDDILKITEQSKWEDDAKTVKQVISLTFAKACDEPYWSSMYAQFCAKMCTKISSDIALKEDGVVKFTGGDLARRLLLATCQKEYEKGWSDKLNVRADGTPVEMMSDEYYIMAAAKRRGLGLVKFIGQLYLLNILTDKVVVFCLINLSKNVEDPTEDTLESLTQLATAVGPKFDLQENTKRTMDVVFDNIKKILSQVKLPSRIKFMLMDLQDLRARKWISDKQETGPKTIKEIHDDAEIKKLEEEKAALERRRNNKGGFNDSRSNSSRGGSNWGSQPKRVESSTRITPVKDSKGFTAVSRSQSSRIESSLSPRENSKRTESLQSATNMFAALGGDEDHENEHVESTDVEQPQDDDETLEQQQQPEESNA